MHYWSNTCASCIPIKTTFQNPTLYGRATSDDSVYRTLGADDPIGWCWTATRNNRVVSLFIAAHYAQCYYSSYHYRSFDTTGCAGTWPKHKTTTQIRLSAPITSPSSFRHQNCRGREHRNRNARSIHRCRGIRRAHCDRTCVKQHRPDFAGCVTGRPFSIIN